jgi:endonuclease-3
MKNKIIIDYLDTLIPDPKCELNYSKDYELLIAVMLSAQTTDKRVNQVTSVLFNKYPSLHALANADYDDVANIIRSIGTYHKKAHNVIAIAQKLEPLGMVPQDRDFLESLPGVGRKSTNVVLSEIYGMQVLAVDTHIDRVAKRLYYATEKDDVREVENKLTRAFKNDYDLRRIHHELLLFGRYYCTARNPKCDNCKLKDICRYNKRKD